jgi:hypothetical protein
LEHRYLFFALEEEDDKKKGKARLTTGALSKPNQDNFFATTMLKHEHLCMHIRKSPETLRRSRESLLYHALDCPQKRVVD